MNASFFCIFLRLVTAGTLVPGILIQAADGAAAEAIVIRGRVVDSKDGAPIANTQVKAYAPALGPDLWSASGERFSADTDAEGRFAIAVPGRELLFWLVAGLGGSGSQSAISGEGGETEIRFARGSREGRFEGRIMGQDGNGVPDLDVQLVGEHGVFTTRTDAAGSFRLSNLPWFGQGVLVAALDSYVLPQNVVRASDGQWIETLVPAKTLTGKVFEKDSGSPIAGVIVTVRPWFSSGFRRATTTGSDGEWTMHGLPPGRYLAEFDALDHFDPDAAAKANGGARPIQLGDGVLPMKTVLLRKASVKGVVRTKEGRPVAGAVVAFPKDRPWVRTDATGGFVITTRQLDLANRLTAFDPVFGLTTVDIPPLAGGEERLIPPIELPGSARIKGTVADEAGEGVEGIWIYPPPWIGSSFSVRSRRDGGFDLGRLALPAAGQEFTLEFKSPRPGSDGMRKRPEDSIWRATSQPAVDRTFHLDARVTLRPQPNELLDVKVLMKPAELLTLRGKVAEPGGSAPVNGQVFLFSGTAGEEWAQRALPQRRGGGFILQNARMLSGWECGDDGAFLLQVLRHDGENGPDGTRFSLGIASNGRPRAIETGIVIPPDKRELLIEIELPELRDEAPLSGH